MRFLVAVSFVLVAAGCSHAVHIEVKDQPTAEISVDGVAVGRAPATYTESLAGKDSAYRVEAKLPSGQVIAQDVKRTETSMGAVGAGAGAGVGACCALGVVGVATNLTLGLVIPFAGVPFFCLGCLALPGGPVAAYFLSGQSPDSVVVSSDAATAPRPVAPPAAVAPAPTPPPAPLAPSAPPPPTTY